MRGGLVFLAAWAVLQVGCERPQPETTYYAVKLEYIPSSDAPAVSLYHQFKGCVTFQRDMNNPAEGFGKPWAANPPDNTWTRRMFTGTVRDGRFVSDRKAWNSDPCPLCVK